jgi:PIN domain nuclease of toxin-antitoxin system
VDTAAVLAIVHREPGADRALRATRQGALISAVNVAEIATKLAERGDFASAIRQTVGRLELEVVPYDDEQAIQTGLLRPLTRVAGLSLGDRACIALARQTSLPVVTADRIWASLQLGVTVHLIR